MKTSTHLLSAQLLLMTSNITLVVGKVTFTLLISRSLKKEKRVIIKSQKIPVL
jgi:hypothetical protein